MSKQNYFEQFFNNNQQKNVGGQKTKGKINKNYKNNASNNKRQNIRKSN